MQVLVPGTIVDKRFAILATVGAGGRGIVYRAEQLGLGRTVALNTCLKAGNDIFLRLAQADS